MCNLSFRRGQVFMSQPATLLERKKEENEHIMLLEAFIALSPYQAKIGQNSSSIVSDVSWMITNHFPHQTLSKQSTSPIFVPQDLWMAMLMEGWRCSCWRISTWLCLRGTTFSTPSVWLILWRSCKDCCLTTEPIPKKIPSPLNKTDLHEMFASIWKEFYITDLLNFAKKWKIKSLQRDRWTIATGYLKSSLTRIFHGLRLSLSHTWLKVWG